MKADTNKFKVQCTHHEVKVRLARMDSPDFLKPSETVWSVRVSSPLFLLSRLKRQKQICMRSQFPFHNRSIFFLEFCLAKTWPSNGEERPLMDSPTLLETADKCFPLGFPSLIHWTPVQSFVVFHTTKAHTTMLLLSFLCQWMQTVCVRAEGIRSVYSDLLANSMQNRSFLTSTMLTKCHIFL